MLEESKRELVSTLGELDRVLTSTHAFFAAGLLSTTSSSTTPLFTPFADSLSNAELLILLLLLLLLADGVSSNTGRSCLATTATFFPGVAMAAFASREPRTARLLVGDAIACIVLYVIRNSPKQKKRGRIKNNNNE